MKASAAAPTVLWLVPLLVLSLVGAFVWQAITGPSDGTHLPPGEMVWQPDGVIVTPWVERPGGLQRGDRVIAVAGQSIATWAERLFHVAATPTRWQIGDTIPYTVVRAGQLLTIMITLEPYPWALVWRTYWGAFLFALAFPLLGTFVLSKRPGVRATQLFFVACWCFGPPYIPWVMGLQIGDLIKKDNFWLYRTMILVFVGFVAFIHLGFHLFPKVYPLFSKSPVFIRFLYIVPFLLQIALLLAAQWSKLDALHFVRWWYLSDRLITLFGLIGVIVVSLKSYYYTAHGAVTQQQIRWIVFTLSLIGGMGMLLGMAPEFVIGRPILPYNNYFFLFALQIPLAFILAILRDHLFDIDIIIKRTLVYSALTSSVVILYIVLTGFMNILLQTNRVEASLLLTATVTVLLFQPLHAILQRGVNRLTTAQPLDYEPLSQPSHHVDRSTTPVVSPPESIDRQPRPPRLLPAHRLTLVQGSLIITMLFVLLVHFIALPVRYQQLVTVSSTGETAVGQLRPSDMATLAQAGISVGFYGIYFTALETIINLLLIGVAFLIIWGRPYDRMALCIAVALLLLAFYLPLVSSLATLALAWQKLLLLVRVLTGIIWLPLFYLFPDGHFVPRWLRWPTLLWLSYVVACLKVPVFRPPYSYGAALTPSQIGAVVWLVLWFMSGVWAQIYRYRYVATELQKQQTKWVIYGFTIAITMTMGGIAFLVVATSRQGEQLDWVARFVGPTLILLGGLQLPITIAIAILRYRLFDIHLLLKRTLVYGVLTAIVAGIYVVAVGALGSWSQVSGNWLVSFIATGLVAVLFQPLRQRLQRAVNHLVYGERDDPYAVLSQLGRRLETTLAPEAIPSTITETVAQTLKLPYTAVTLRQEEAFVLAAEYADAPHQHPPPTITFPLFYQTEIVGQLRVAPRAVGEAFTPGEQRLLEDIAHQAGIAVHAVRLASDLQRSRQRLVTAREEERRRLRRDLHDGLGPVLAGLMLKVDTARDGVNDPTTTAAILLDMKEHLQSAIGDIRRLIYNLRPPALDEFGLRGAVQEYLLQLNLPATLAIQMEPAATAEPWPPLPAAVEVAAYRIVQEAVTNVIRHAQAHHALVRLTVEQPACLCIEVCDDGRGLSTGWHAGVGVTAMRERVAELGGVYVIESLASGGVQLRARLPWPEG